jgi:hypothetical protein
VVKNKRKREGKGVRSEEKGKREKRRGREGEGGD